jgi:DeoR family transcriptional regulator, fructose operon transcriptional repressor
MGGSMTEQLLEGLYFDSVFMGADAIDIQGNCLVSDPRNVRLTQIMLRRGRRKVLMADHTKVGAVGHAVYTKLSELDIWYTTTGVDPGMLRRFSKQTAVRAVKP